ncbi:MAG: hypothetical protein ABIO02_01255 [Patescibacteria group bacterium]
MKTNFIAVLILTVLLAQTSVAVNAQTTSPSASVSPSKTASPSAKPASEEDKQIESVKNSVANKVEELRKKGQKAAAGNITAIKDNKVTIKNSLDVITEVKLDPQLTKVYQISGASKKDLKQTDLKKNMYIIVSGPLLDNVISANVVYVDEQYFVKSGKVVEVNATEAFLKISTSERDTITLDIESRLKVQIMDSKTTELSTITSYTKVKEGDTVHFIYTKSGDEKQVNRYSALKVIVIPQEYFLQK